MRVKKGDVLVCPICDNELDPVEDFVVPGRPDGVRYESECGWCDALIVVTQRACGEEFDIEAVEAEEDE